MATLPQQGTASPERPAAPDNNLADLVSQLASQGSHLAEQQVALIKAEVREAADDVKAAVGSLVGAAVFGIAGLGVVLMGLGYLLGDAIGDRDWGTLIVGLITLVVAYLLYSAARKKISATNLAPDRTARTLGRTPDAATGHLHTETRA